LRFRVQLRKLGQAELNKSQGGAVQITSV